MKARLWGKFYSQGMEEILAEEEEEQGGARPASSSGEDEEDLKFIEWGVPLGSAAKIHRLREGILPACGGGKAAAIDRQGIGAKSARARFGDHDWCRTCARDVRAILATRIGS